MSKPHPKMPPGYYWLMNKTEVPIIVEYYCNPDAGKYGQWGFGFNISDGGGFIPQNELTSDSVLVGPINKPMVYFGAPDNLPQVGEKESK